MDRPGSGLRRLIGLLLVLNLGVLGYGAAVEYWGGRGDPPVVFNAEKVRLLDEVRPATAESDSAPTPGVPAEPTVAAVVPEATPSASRCLLWPGLDADALAQVEARLTAAGIAAGDYDLVLDKKLGWWVYLPPLPDADALRATLDEIRAKGVTDLAPVRSGSMANAVSLGAFPTLGRARDHAARMGGKGVEGVRYAPRPGSGAVRLNIAERITPETLAKLAWPAGAKPGACPAE